MKNAVRIGGSVVAIFALLWFAFGDALRPRVVTTSELARGLRPRRIRLAGGGSFFATDGL